MEQYKNINTCYSTQVTKSYTKGDDDPLETIPDKYDILLEGVTKKELEDIEDKFKSEEQFENFILTLGKGRKAVSKATGIPEGTAKKLTTKLYNKLKDKDIPTGFVQCDDCPKYAVDMHGRVINIRTRKILTSSVHPTNGYVYVSTQEEGCRDSKSKRVHRLMAQAFVPNPENKPEVNHINGIKSDNRIENLEWVTRSENEKHAYDTGLACGYRCNNSKRLLTEDEVKRARELRKTTDLTYKEIARIYNVGTSTIFNAIKGNKYGNVE